MDVEIRSENRNWKLNNSGTRWGITNTVSCDKTNDNTNDSTNDNTNDNTNDSTNDNANDNTNDNTKVQKMRSRSEKSETSDHIVSACPASANEHCMTRQERMYAQLRFNIANKAMFDVLLVLGLFHFLLLCKVGFEVL